MWNRSTLGLAAGSALAAFSAWIDFLAILTLAAYGYQASAFLMALVSALFLLPAMVLAPAAGRWLDRGRPERILVAALLLRGLTTAVLLLSPSIWVFCLLVALRSTLTLPVDPAGNVLASRLLARADVPRYFGILGVLRNTSKIGAPVIGASLASLYGEGLALTASVAITLLAAGLLAVCVKATPAALPGAPSSAAAAQTPPGADAANPLLTQLLCTVTVFAFVVFLVNNQLPVLLRDAGFDKALLGVLVSCSGAGGILAAAWMSRSNAAVLARDPMLATTTAVLGVALCLFALGLAFRLPAAVAPIASGVIFFATGAFASIEAIRANTVVVQHFPSCVGAVSARLQAWQSTAMLVAPWVAALLIPHLSPSTLLLGDGLFGFVALLAVAVHFRAARVAPPSQSRTDAPATESATGAPLRCKPAPRR